MKLYNFAPHFILIFAKSYSLAEQQQQHNKIIKARLAADSESNFQSKPKTT